MQIGADPKGVADALMTIAPHSASSASQDPGELKRAQLRLELTSPRLDSTKPIALVGRSGAVAVVLAPPAVCRRLVRARAPRELPLVTTRAGKSR